MKTMDAVKYFIRSRLSKGLSLQTIRWYRGILSLFAQSFPMLPDSPEDIEVFLLSCKAGDERRHGYYRALRCFYRFLRKRLNLPNPLEMVEPPRRKKKDPSWLTPEELDCLLSYPHPARIKAALLFLVDTGCRVGELASLKVSDLRETPWGYIATVRGKTGARMVPLSTETYSALKKVLPFGYATDRLRFLVSLAFKSARINGSAITLRHTFGTLWEGDDTTLQSIMGHVNLSTTRGYRHLRIRYMSQQHRLFSPLKMVLSRTKEFSML